MFVILFDTLHRPLPEIMGYKVVSNIKELDEVLAEKDKLTVSHMPPLVTMLISQKVIDFFAT